MKKCSKNFRKIIKKLDHFGTFITFRINEEIEYKSIIGGVFTIFFTAFAIFYISTMSINFLGRKNITFIYSKTIHQHPILNLSKVGFNFAFGAQYSKTAVPAIKNSHRFFDYTVNIIESLSNNNISGKSNIIITPIGIRKCEQNDFPELNEHYQLNGLHFMYCPIFNLSSNFSIEGLYTGSYYKYVSIKISLTDYALNNIKELDEYLEKTPIDIAIFYKDTGLNYLDRLNPLPPYLNYYYKGVDTEFYKTSEISFSRLELSTDQHLFFKRPIKIARPIHSSIHDNFKSIKRRKEEKENGICEFIIHASSVVYDLKRSYEKIPQFAANIAGLLNFVFFILIIIANYIERKAVDQKIIRKMLKFRGNKNIEVDYFVDKFSKNLKLEFSNMIDKKNKKWKYHSEQLKTSDKLFDEKIEKNDTNANINNIIDNEYKGENKIKVIQLKKKNSFFEGMSNINSESVPYKIEEDKELGKNIKKKQKSKEKVKEKNKKKELKLDKSFSNSNNSNRKILNKKTIDLDIQYFNSKEMKNIKNPDIHPQSPKSKLQQELVVKLNLCQIILNFFCFWCTKNSYKKYIIMKNAEKKIHYYMDILTYVKTIQEFELLKGILFNENNIKLFEFASKPSMKIMNENFIFYHPIFKELNSFKNIRKDDIDQLYLNYKEILQQENTIENVKLLNIIKNDLKFLQI